MAYFLLRYLLPALLPAILYFLYVWWRERRTGIAAARGEILREAPWPWLASAGIALMAVVLAYFALSGGEVPGGRYQPPHAVDGEVVPGRVVR